MQRATADDAGDQETASTSPTVTETATAASLTESEPESESSSVALGSEPKLTTAWADDGSLQVDWEPVAGADSYQLRLAKLPFVVVDGETTDYVLTSFKPGQNYLLELLARDGDGTPLAGAVEAVTAPGVDESSPNAELNVEQVSVVRQATSAIISWTNVADNEGYGVFVDGRWVEPTAVKDQTTYELTDLDPDQNYLVSVRTSTLNSGLSQRVPAVIPAHR